MNIHTIVDGRLVEDPREFETKDGRTLCSIRVADNAMGKDSKYETMFVSIVLNEALTKVVQERGLAKGDVVTVSGDLRIRLYEKKAGKGKKKSKGGDGGQGIAYEIPFVNAFRIQSCAGEGKAEDADDDEEDEVEEKETEGGISDDPFDSPLED